MIQYHERVRIISCDEFPEYVGMEGYVSGMGIEDDGTISAYSVQFENEDVEGCVFEPDQVTGTGEVISREEFMKKFYGDSVFVRVCVGKDGQGSIEE